PASLAIEPEMLGAERDPIRLAPGALAQQPRRGRAAQLLAVKRSGHVAPVDECVGAIPPVEPTSYTGAKSLDRQTYRRGTARRPENASPMPIRPDGRPPFRADHVGSLLRPPALRQAFKRHEAGETPDDEFTRIQDQCIRDAVALQEEAGLSVATDGEFRRGSYWGRFVERLSGFEIRKAIYKFRDDQGHEVEFTAPYAAGKVARRQPLALDEFTFLRDATTATAKTTLPSPSTMHFYRGAEFAERSVYSEAEPF